MTVPWDHECHWQVRAPSTTPAFLMPHLMPELLRSATNVTNSVQCAHGVPRCMQSSGVFLGHLPRHNFTQGLGQKRVFPLHKHAHIRLSDAKLTRVFRTKQKTLRIFQTCRSVWDTCDCVPRPPKSPHSVPSAAHLFHGKGWDTGLLSTRLHPLLNVLLTPTSPCFLNLIPECGSCTPSSS